MPTIFALCKLNQAKNGHFEAFPRPSIQNPHFRGQKKYSQVSFAQFGAITKNVNSLCKLISFAGSFIYPEHVRVLQVGKCVAFHLIIGCLLLNTRKILCQGLAAIAVRSILYRGFFVYSNILTDKEITLSSV